MEKFRIVHRENGVPILESTDKDEFYVHNRKFKTLSAARKYIVNLSQHPFKRNK